MVETVSNFKYMAFQEKDIKGLIFWHHRLNCNCNPLRNRIPLDVVIIASNSQFLSSSISNALNNFTDIFVVQKSMHAILVLHCFLFMPQ